MKMFRSPRLWKVIFVIISLLMLFIQAKARANPADDLAAGLRLARQEDWAGALAAAGEVGSLPRDIIAWQWLRSGKAPFDVYPAFLARRPDFPGLPLLRKTGEDVLPADADPNAVIAYFAGQAPQTGVGALRLADALMRLGEEARAAEVAIVGWTEMALSADLQAQYLDRYGTVLAEHHTKRLDNALWREAAGEAERMLDLVDKDWQASAKARIALIRGENDGITDLINAVPAKFAKGAGLAYARFRYRIEKDNDAGAAELMLERSESATTLGRPELWSAKRLDYARMWMREGKLKDAYALASQHGLSAGDDYAELEWLSGYLALRRDQPMVALEHFSAFRRAVATPISLGRAGYWEGRALEAMGAKADAKAAYSDGARYQSSFYGLLAAEKAGISFDEALLGTEVLPDWRDASFLKSEVVKAALLLDQAGDRDLAKRFIRHYAESVDAKTWALIAQMWLDLNEPHIALSMAKFAADQGVTLPRPYFPVISLAKDEIVVPTALALAIARRESEFNPVVVSPAGARGLMQVMPATAEAMAKRLGLKYEEGKLLSDPDYNLALGAAYLDVLIDEFGMNLVLVSAGYNAGPGRPRRWIQERGDPRSGTIDVVDWIEAVPFTETRNYIMRVIEGYVVYKARLEGTAGPVNLTQILTGN